MQLELEGLVKNIPNKGAVVIGISEKDIEDIYAVRIRIEGLAARLCAENISAQEIGMSDGKLIFLPRGAYRPLKERYFHFYCEES